MNAVYHVDQQARALCALAGDEIHNRFVIGTAALRGPNSIHVVDFDEEANDVSCVQVLPYEHEIRALSCCPSSEGLCAVSHVPRGGKGVINFVKLDISEDGAEGAEEETSPRSVAQIEAPGGAPPLVCGWNPLDEGDDEVRVLIASRQGLCVTTLALEGEGGMLEASANVSFGALDRCNAAQWDPHHANVVAAAVGTGVVLWDPRTSDAAKPALLHAHIGRVTDIAMNPNRPWYCATGGEDGQVRLWDLRRSSPSSDAETVDTCGALRRTLRGHAHAITCVRFNPYHDQLLLSAAADGAVCLWRASSVSSAPLVDLPDGESDEDSGEREETHVAPDALVSRLGDHEDTPYGLAWSPAQPWFYASLSLPGRAVFCPVPSDEKYKVLL